jgi:hypothetical protein
VKPETFGKDSLQSNYNIADLPCHVNVCHMLMSIVHLPYTAKFDDETEESVKTQSSNATVPVETPRTTDRVGPSVVSVECNGRPINTQGETTGHPPMNLAHQVHTNSKYQSN